ncbi:MAG: MBL fold metallo-hydrolase, partial [bacterium]
DYETIRELNEKVGRFYVPLGLAAHLMRWGVSEANIYEMDWWQETAFDNLLLACVPMRHFSGRAITDRNATLWAGWVIKSEDHAVIHTGDSGYGPHFKKIGEKYGPFDFTMVECGQYNENWKLIHMMPEETVQAHQDMQGKYLIPIHWGRFNLALHPWKDPAIRVSAAANENDVALITPRVGKTLTLNPSPRSSGWWRNAD